MNKLLPTFTILIAVLALGSAARAEEPTNPVGFSLSCTIPPGQLICTAQAAPPAGKRFVLEYVSAKVFAPSGTTAQLSVNLATPHLPPGGSIALRHYVALTPTTGGTDYFANHPLRMYGLTEAPVTIQGQRIGYLSSTGSVQYEVNFTGHLLP